MEIMPITERINVRGAINALEVGSTPLQLPRCEYKPSSVRATAGSVAADTGKTFSVSLIKELITVTRNS